MLPILLGQAPARAGDGLPFSGPSGQRLCKLLDLDSYQALAHTLDLRNLINEVQAKRASGKGDEFSRALAEQGWLKMRLELGHDFHLICAGRQVAHVVGGSGLATTRFFEPRKLMAGTVYVMPHPSGISHYWNDPKQVRRAQVFLKRVIAQA